jgi:hypothetical protein
MRGKPPVSLVLVVPLLFGVWLLASCATQSGSTLKAVSSVEGRAGAKPGDTQSEKPPEKPPAKPPAELPAEGKKGLEIVSNPSNAEVILDSEYRGRTPLLLDAVGDGRHLLVLQKNGYYAVARWIDYAGDYMLYETALLPITGFLSLSISPQGSSVTVGDGRVSPGFSELPVGSYSVVARAFGYADYRDTVSILERSLTTLDIVLSPVPFDYTKLSAVRTAVNPDNPGILGSLELAFSVTGPGSGTLTVLDSSSRTVFTDRLPEFSTWDQSYRWNCSDDEGRPLPDGAYRVLLTGKGEDPEPEASREIEMRIDRSLRVAPRSLWSGAAGLLFAPSAEVLPAGAFQSALLAAAFADGSMFRAPVTLGARLGLRGGVELDFLADIILTDSDALFGGSLSARYAVASLRGPVGFGAALQAKISVQYDPAAGVLLSDTLANFTGISLGLPLQLTAGPVSLLAAVDLVGSLWEPYPEGLEATWRDPRITTWLYLRGGLLLDFGQIVGGLSVSARTSPLFVDPFGIAPRVQAGAEIHWLIPSSHLILSGILAAEVSGLSDLYLMGGGGLGFLY